MSDWETELRGLGRIVGVTDAAASAEVIGDAITSERETLRNALRRLASSEAFTTSFYVPNNIVGDELRARMEFAYRALCIADPQQ